MWLKSCDKSVLTKISLLTPYAHYFFYYIGFNFHLCFTPGENNRTPDAVTR